MAHKQGVCTGHYEFFEMVRRLAEGYGEQGTATAGANTGNGTLSRADLNPAGSDEVWTINCNDAATPGSEVWTVTGSTSGILVSDYITGSEFDYTVLAFKINAGGTSFIVGDDFTIDSGAFTGSGNGTLGSVETKPAAVTETFTLTVTNASAGSDTWSVVGSVSGALGSATTGVAYTSVGIDFLITNGGTNFSVNDEFIVEVRESELTNLGQEWAEVEHDGVSDDRNLVLKGQGLGSSEEIFVRFTTTQHVINDYYNMSARYYTSYTSTTVNSGASSPKWMPMIQSDLRYWVAINGQRISIGCKIETAFMSLYAGFYNSYHTRTSLPYPICVYGMKNATSATRYDEPTLEFAFNSPSDVVIRLISGSNFTSVLPHSYVINQTSNTTAFGVLPTYLQHTTLYDTQGIEVPMVPISIIGQGLMGELDGVFYTRGISQVWLNVVNDGTYEYIIGKSFDSSAVSDYFTIRMD